MKGISLIKTTIGLLIFTASILGSIWQIPASNEPLRMKAKGFRIGTYRLAIVISHTAQPGAYYTILPYDDLVVFEDGVEQRLKTAGEEEKEEESAKLFKERIFRFKKDLYTLTGKKIQSTVGEESALETTYGIKVEEDKILIERIINNRTTQKIAGIGRGLIFNPQDEVWLNDQRLNQTAGETRIVREGVSSVKVVNPGLAEALKIETHPTDTIVVDLEFNLIVIRTSFSNLKEETLKDQQVIKVVPAI